MSMVICTYNISLRPRECELNIQLQVVSGGAVEMAFYAYDRELDVRTKHVYTLESDIDIKGFIDILKSLRVASLESKGYKVVQ